MYITIKFIDGLEQIGHQTDQEKVNHILSLLKHV
jgi:hypothetical protein